MEINIKKTPKTFLFNRKDDEAFGRWFDETYKVWETDWTTIPVQLAKCILPAEGDKLPKKGKINIKLFHKYPNAVGSGKTSQYFAQWKISSSWRNLFKRNLTFKADFDHKLFIYDRQYDQLKLIFMFEE